MAKRAAAASTRFASMVRVTCGRPARRWQSMCARLGSSSISRMCLRLTESRWRRMARHGSRNSARTGKIGKVDPDTGKVTKYTVPTPDAWPRRIQVADDGTIWFAEFGESPSTLTQTGKIAHFDPKTETFKEYTLPGKKRQPLRLRHGCQGPALVFRHA